MKNLIVKLQKYLEEVLSIKATILPWKEQRNLPFFLSDAGTFFETSLLNKPCLLMVSHQELTPATIQKYWEQVMKKWNGYYIYVSDLISSYNRKRLMQHHIPFIIPNNQIYIPDLGLDLREHFKQQRAPKKIFSPATQVVIIHALLKENGERLIPSELAKRLHYSPMTMSRVFDELEAAGIGNFINKGRERQWVFDGSKRDLWEQTKNMLRSPIHSHQFLKLYQPIQKLINNDRFRESYPVKILPRFLSGRSALSGISNLAEMTMINPPVIPIYATSLDTYRDVNLTKGLQRSSSDEADLELEIWHYDPQLFSKEGRVDPFSLYLSLRESGDERIEMALEALMKEKLNG